MGPLSQHKILLERIITRVRFRALLNMYLSFFLTINELLSCALRASPMQKWIGYLLTKDMEARPSYVAY